MSLQLVVLGEVIERPGYGYQLTQRLQARIKGAEFGDQTVYPALRALERKRYVRQRALGADRLAEPHKARIWYEAEDAGREHFAAWFGTPLEQKPLRDELRLRIAAARIEDLPLLLDVLHDLEQSLMDRTQELAGPGGGVDVDELIASKGDWRVAGQVWLRRSEISYLASTIETIHDARRLMLAALKRHAR